MRAFVTVTAAVFALGVLGACGNTATSSSAGQGRQTTESSQSAKPVEPPSVVAEPTPPAGTPPAGKPQNPSGGEPPPVTIGPNGPVVPAGVTEVPSSRIDASALPNYIEYGNRVWAYDGGFSLQMFASATSSCTGAEAIVTEQASDSVAIVVRPIASPMGGRPDDSVCGTVMTPVPVTVTLDTPLQDRRIVLSAE